MAVCTLLSLLYETLRRCSYEYKAKKKKTNAATNENWPRWQLQSDCNEAVAYHSVAIAKNNKRRHLSLPIYRAAWKHRFTYSDGRMKYVAAVRAISPYINDNFDHAFGAS